VGEVEYFVCVATSLLSGGRCTVKRRSPLEMNTPQQLAEKKAEKTDAQLLDMVPTANDWTPEALDAGRAELQKRNLPIPPAASPPPNLDFAINPSGRKPLLTARTLDILISIIIPGWGVLAGFMALLKGEKK
jgi:hypothetical protein